MVEWQWLALSLIPGLGIKTINYLLESFETINGLFEAQPEVIVQKTGISLEMATRIHRAKESQSFQIEKRLVEQTEGLKLICIESQNYPTRLKEISSSPLVLYWQGTLNQAETPCIAFVGSRSCTAYGKKHTKRLICELARYIPNLIIVSGLARGIDTVAHETALENGLSTIAVLGGGLHHIYPPENSSLAKTIMEKGVILSEFPLKLKPLAKNFPIRNRIISGLSQGVVITESRKASGAKHVSAKTLPALEWSGPRNAVGLAR